MNEVIEQLLTRLEEKTDQMIGASKEPEQER
jgi:hypothetical protein